MSSVLFFVMGGVLFLLGFLAQALRTSLVMKVLAINIMSVGVFMVFLALANRNQPADPMVHAMVLTGIVVAVSASAFALALIRGVYQRQGRATLPEDAPLETNQTAKPRAPR